MRTYFVNPSLSRPQRALAAARAIVRDSAEELVCELEIHPAISYAIGYFSEYSFAPSLDVAVRLVVDCYWGYRVRDGQLRRFNVDNVVSEESIAAAKELVEKCVSALSRAGEPYAIMTHVHGDEQAEFHFGGQTETEAISALRHALADALMYAG